MRSRFGRGICGIKIFFVLLHVAIGGFVHLPLAAPPGFRMTKMEHLLFFLFYFCFFFLLSFFLAYYGARGVP